MKVVIDIKFNSNFMKVYFLKLFIYHEGYAHFNDALFYENEEFFRTFWIGNY